MDEPSFDHSTFSRIRARLLDHAVAHEFFTRVVAQARGLQLLSDEHFTVDGTLIEAWASLKSFKRKDRDRPSRPTIPVTAVNFRGERRCNATHQSTTDPEAKLAKKGAGKEAKLCYSANALMENRNGLLIEFAVEPADGSPSAKRARDARDRIAGQPADNTGADKGYDTTEFVASCRALRSPHTSRAMRSRRRFRDRPRTARHSGYAVSQRIRKRVEEIFGWMKTVGGLRRTRYRGLDRAQLHAYLVAAAYNLLRIARLSPAPV